MASSLSYLLHSSDHDEVQLVRNIHRRPGPLLSDHPPHVISNATDHHSHAGIPQTVPQEETAPASRKRQRRHSPRARASYPRKRAVQACRTCRLRRTKCDNERPSCSSCARMGMPCLYQLGDPSTFDPASLAILARLDGLEELLRAKTTIDSRPLSYGTDHDPVSSPSPFSLPKDLDSPALERTAESIPRYINIEAVLSWPVFEHHGFDQRLDLRRLLQANNENHTDPPSISVSSDFELCAANELLQQFLNNVHIFNPVLEEAKINEYMRHARFNGLGWDAQSCLLLLIYALGSISIPYGKSPMGTSSTFRGSPEFQQAESFFFTAQKRMGMLLCGSGVIEAQCFFLAGVYLMATLRPFEAWKMFVQALACCQGFYSQRRVCDEPQLEAERHTQERTYWTCFKSELELRLELNVSERGAWDLTYPTFFPSPPEGLRSQGEAVWYFYLAEIALRRMGNRILNYIYQNESSTNSQLHINEAITNFEEQADGWLHSLPAPLRLDTKDPTTTQYSALRFILNGHLLDCYEMMYWPSVVDAIHGRLPLPSTLTRTSPPPNPTPSSNPNANPPAPASANTATSPALTLAAGFARKGLAVCVERIRKNESGFFHRHHGTWLMLRSCTRSALVLVAVARCSAVAVAVAGGGAGTGGGLSLAAELLPDEWEDALLKVLAMLRFWRDESREVADRLQILEGLVVELGIVSLGRG